MSIETPHGLMDEATEGALLKRLLQRGDKVFIADGILQVQPLSGKPVPSHWYKENKQVLAVEIAQAIGVKVYSYISYSTGRYKNDNKGVYYPGITLQFSDIVTGENPYAIFNVSLKRSRTSKHGKKGDPLPKGRFYITKKYAFYRFWGVTKVKHPRRVSEYDEHMGKLTYVLFIMELNEKGKARNESIKPASITYKSIIDALGIIDVVRQDDGNSSATVRQKDGSDVRQGNDAKARTMWVTDGSKYEKESVRSKLIRKGGNMDALQSSNTLNTPHTNNTYNQQVNTLAPQSQSADDCFNDYEPPEWVTQY